MAEQVSEVAPNAEELDAIIHNQEGKLDGGHNLAMLCCINI
jgi:hypothetical protein